MPFYAKVILDSVGPTGNRLTTIEFTLPKLWLAEFNTHCMFARNGASTRAIPFKKQVEQVMKDPFVPSEWPMENPGMTAHKNVEHPTVLALLRLGWQNSMLNMISDAKIMAEGHGVHKQLAGRLLEPWRYQTTLVTGDEGSYSNFFVQRRDKHASPEMREAADCIGEAYRLSVPQVLQAGDWHLPLIRPEDLKEAILTDLNSTKSKYGLYTHEYEHLRCVSAARCARLSYLTHHGVRDINEDLKLFNTLIKNGHWSPLEHVCQALAPVGKVRGCLLEWLGGQTKSTGKWQGWLQYRKTFANEYRTNYFVKPEDVD